MQNLVVLQRPCGEVAEHIADAVIVERADAFAPLLVHLIRPDCLTLFQQEVAHVVVEALAEARLHRRPDGGVPAFVLRRRQAHEEVIAQQIALSERHALGVQAFEDAVRVVLRIQRDGDKRQLGDDNAHEALEVQTRVELLLERISEGPVGVADGRRLRFFAGLDNRGEGIAVLIGGCDFRILDTICTAVDKVSVVDMIGE